MTGFANGRYLSPLRYPGGKARLANFIKILLLANDLTEVDYVEPYAGGASVALSLLFEEFASSVHINDINRGVFSFWNSVLSRTDELCRRVSDTRVTIEEWQRQRAVQASMNPDELDLAFSTFFLNRTNKSGIISGGVIGGLDQTGDWKIDARYNKRDLCKRIEKIARYRSRIMLTGIDAGELLRIVSRRAEDSMFLYLDPPYYVKGEGLYDNFYEHGDHVEIARQVRRLRCPWIVSYDAVGAVGEIYSGLRTVEYSVGYSARERRQGSEMIFFSPGLRIPTSTSIGAVGGKEVDAARRSASRL